MLVGTQQESGLLSCTKEDISDEVVGNISGRSSKLLLGSHCCGGLCCRVQPTVLILGAQSNGADDVSGVGSVHAGCLFSTP